MYETMIHDIDHLHKHLMPTWFDFDQDIIDAVADQWSDHLRSCVHASSGHFEHLLLNESLLT